MIHNGVVAPHFMNTANGGRKMARDVSMNAIMHWRACYFSLVAKHGGALATGGAGEILCWAALARRPKGDESHTEYKSNNLVGGHLVM